MWHQGYYIKLKLSVANILDRKKEKSEQIRRIWIPANPYHWPNDY